MPQGRFAPTVYQTAAILASEPGPQTNERYAYVKETDAVYAWVSGDTTDADNLAYIEPSGGSSGRWRRIVAAEPRRTRSPRSSSL